MRNHEVTVSQLLLDRKGELREPGWSRKLVQKYRRSMIKAPKFRIKEWDYYLVVNDNFAAAFTISDDGYIGLQSVSLLVFGDDCVPEVVYIIFGFKHFQIVRKEPAHIISQCHSVSLLECCALGLAMVG